MCPRGKSHVFIEVSEGALLYDGLVMTFIASTNLPCKLMSYRGAPFTGVSGLFPCVSIIFSGDLSIDANQAGGMTKFSRILRITLKTSSLLFA